jgi:hypothetical protein
MYCASQARMRDAFLPDGFHESKILGDVAAHHLAEAPTDEETKARTCAGRLAPERSSMARTIPDPRAPWLTCEQTRCRPLLRDDNTKCSDTCSSGSGMVLAIGDLAGAQSSRCSPPRQHRQLRSRSSIGAPLGRTRDAVIALPRYGTRRVAQKSAAIIPFVKEMLSRRLFEQRGNPACKGNRFRILTNWPHDLQSYRHPVRSCECRDREARPPHQSPDTVED